MLIPIAIKTLNNKRVYILRDDVDIPNQNHAYVSFSEFVMSLHPLINDNDKYYIRKFLNAFDGSILQETDTMYARTDGLALPQIFLTLRGASRIVDHIRSPNKESINNARIFYKEMYKKYG